MTSWTSTYPEQANDKAPETIKNSPIGRQEASDEFWHGAGKMPDPPPKIQVAEEAAAVIRSLGEPPLTGQEEVAKHYFDAVYLRSVNLAGALAAAAEMIGDEDDELATEQS